MVNQEGKKGLAINLIASIMVNQEGKKGLVINLMVLKIKIGKNLNIHLGLKNKEIVKGEKIELFKL